ncbi:MAG: DNA topoisomerase IV subunit B [Rhodospirillaceae bacterium]|nr:DNA topoisomerase IV subunit B [Rhodospirillaceae bacterium]
MADLFDTAAKKKTQKKAVPKKKPAPKAKATAKPPAKAATAPKPKGGGYSAKDIEVLEGLEPVRLRPGMYIGGTDEHALHHLVAELLDNSMDEAITGHASQITVELSEDQIVTVTDNGRGIPIDPHPKFKNKSALEVILTTLHSGGKFSGNAYETSGGLHGVGLSVVNALSEKLTVEIARDKALWAQSYKRGKPTGPLKKIGKAPNRRGTAISFNADSQIFGKNPHFRPAILFRMARSKAYLFRGVEIRWKCAAKLIKGDDKTPDKATLHFPGGLADYVASTLEGRKTLTPVLFSGEAKLNGDSGGKGGKAEWAVAWPIDEQDYFNSYCNTVPTPLGGTHENGFKSALNKGLRAYGELVNNKGAAKISGDDVLGGACVMLSVFIADPQFQGQTKEKMASVEAHKLVENAVRDHFDHWLTGDPNTAKALLERIVERAEERLRKRDNKETKRASATRKLRLPGKLTDCTRTTADGTELFLVEGDSAGGSAKSGRRRETQAILPLRGKTLNVANATDDKIRANQEIQDMIEALGCGTRERYNESALRYERIIIMTDADVDGAHIASLLMTFFFKEMPQLIEDGHLFLALPPLYRLTQGTRSLYARDDAHKDELLKKEFPGKAKVEISRFKGLGEMPAAQLKETTMDPDKRTLLRVILPPGHSDDDRIERRETNRLVENLMGKKPEMRFKFIQENAEYVQALDV